MKLTKLAESTMVSLRAVTGKVSVLFGYALGSIMARIPAALILAVHLQIRIINQLMKSLVDVAPIMRLTMFVNMSHSTCSCVMYVTGIKRHTFETFSFNIEFSN